MLQQKKIKDSSFTFAVVKVRKKICFTFLFGLNNYREEVGRKKIIV
jgi:hypothetical protein